MRSSRWPERPTKGRPSRSSSRPGASPTSMTRAPGLPSAKTSWVAVCFSLQPSKRPSAARSSSRLAAARAAARAAWARFVGGGGIGRRDGRARCRRRGRAARLRQGQSVGKETRRRLGRRFPGTSAGAARRLTGVSSSATSTPISTYQAMRSAAACRSAGHWSRLGAYVRRAAGRANANPFLPLLSRMTRSSQWRRGYDREVTMMKLRMRQSCWYWRAWLLCRSSARRGAGARSRYRPGQYAHRPGCLRRLAGQPARSLAQHRRRRPAAALCQPSRRATRRVWCVGRRTRRRRCRPASRPSWSHPALTGPRGWRWRRTATSSSPTARPTEIVVLRMADGQAKPLSQIGLRQRRARPPYGIAFYPHDKPRLGLCRQTKAAWFASPITSGDLKASGPAETVVATFPPAVTGRATSPSRRTADAVCRGRVRLERRRRQVKPLPASRRAMGERPSARRDVGYGGGARRRHRVQSRRHRTGASSRPACATARAWPSSRPAAVHGARSTSATGSATMCPSTTPPACAKAITTAGPGTTSATTRSRARH